MCEGVGLGLGFKRESVRARYRDMLSRISFMTCRFPSRMTSFGGECLFVA